MLHTTCPEPDTILPPLKDSIKRNRPAGTEAWVRRMARQLDLEYSLRPHGRPPGWRKTEEGEIMEATKAERQQGSEQYKCPRPLYFDSSPLFRLAVSHWNAWASDTQGEQLRCTAADALPTIYRLSDGTIEFGEFVTVPSIYLAASNTLCIRTSPPIAAHRLPLFLASSDDRTVTSYNVEIEMLLDRLVDLPDSQALRYYGQAMEIIVSGANFGNNIPVALPV